MSDESKAVKNTDREIWREREGDFYSDSIHVTEGGGIGMDVGGRVIVLPIRKWHALADWHNLAGKGDTTSKALREALQHIVAITSPGPKGKFHRLDSCHTWPSLYRVPIASVALGVTTARSRKGAEMSQTSREERLWQLVVTWRKATGFKDVFGACASQLEEALRESAPPTAPRSEPTLRDVLRAHWLHAIECNHADKMDTAHCACGTWSSEPCHSVGAALESWIDHVCAELDRAIAAAKGKK